MHILVLNGGSSSIKFSIFSAEGVSKEIDPELAVDGEVAGIGGSKMTLTVSRPGTNQKDDHALETSGSSIEEALASIFKIVESESDLVLTAVGYRVVHPGASLRDHQRITETVLHDIERSIPFAPLHNPDAIAIIRASMQRFPKLLHFACFDTIFHQTMPPVASTYALPKEWREQGIRRYGFHGLSCEWIVRRLRTMPGGVPKRLIIAHLGSGCSVTAVLDGSSIDTSMGFTPTGGVVMGTRPGDLDPGIMLYLLRHEDKSLQDSTSAIESLLNHKSGLVALSGLPNDMRTIRQAADRGNAAAQLAIDIFAHSVTKAIGSYCWLMGGTDAIVFSGGIGEHDPLTRGQILSTAGGLGVQLSSSDNSAKGKGTRKISSADSSTPVFVVPADEDCMIAIHVARMIATVQ